MSHEPGARRVDDRGAIRELALLDSQAAKRRDADGIAELHTRYARFGERGTGLEAARNFTETVPASGVFTVILVTTSSNSIPNT